MSLRDMFLSLTDDNHRITSPTDPIYNCIAWAAGETHRWWEPAAGYYWPVDPMPTMGTVDALITAYESIGFKQIALTDRGVEPNAEKVAIYGIDREYMHAARQLPNGKWTSKIGFAEDIEHDTLECIAGDEYGEVVCMMKRPRF